MKFSQLMLLLLSFTRPLVRGQITCVNTDELCLFIDLDTQCGEAISQIDPAQTYLANSASFWSPEFNVDGWSGVTCDADYICNFPSGGAINGQNYQDFANQILSTCDNACGYYTTHQGNDGECHVSVRGSGHECTAGCAGMSCDYGSNPCEPDLSCISGTCQACDTGCPGMACTSNDNCMVTSNIFCLGGSCQFYATGCPGFSCDSSDQCQADMTCLDGICQDCIWGCPGWECSATSDCQGSLECLSGVCQDCEWGCLGWDCSDSSLCQDPLTCLSGTCQACTEGCPGSECDATSDCQDGLTCLSGTCQVCDWGCPGWDCDKPSDCQGELTCLSATCQICTEGCPGSDCNDDSDCQDGLTCLSGTCENCDWGCPGWECDQTPDCQGDLTCLSGVCQACGDDCPGADCNNDSDCDDEQSCISGECQACDWGCPGWDCEADSDCQSDMVCNAGHCGDPQESAPDESGDESNDSVQDADEAVDAVQDSPTSQEAAEDARDALVAAGAAVEAAAAALAGVGGTAALAAAYEALLSAIAATSAAASAQVAAPSVARAAALAKAMQQVLKQNARVQRRRKKQKGPKCFCLECSVRGLPSSQPSMLRNSSIPDGGDGDRFDRTSNICGESFNLPDYKSWSEGATDYQYLTPEYVHQCPEYDWRLQQGPSNGWKYETEHVYELQLMDIFIQWVEKTTEMQQFLAQNPMADYCNVLVRDIMFPSGVNGNWLLPNTPNPFSPPSAQPRYYGVNQPGHRPIDYLRRQMSGEGNPPNELFYLEQNINQIKGRLFREVSLYELPSVPREKFRESLARMSQASEIMLYLYRPEIRNSYRAVSRRVYNYYEQLDDLSQHAIAQRWAQRLYASGFRWAPLYRRWEAEHLDSITTRAFNWMKHHDSIAAPQLRDLVAEATIPRERQRWKGQLDALNNQRNNGKLSEGFFKGATQALKM